MSLGKEALCIRMTPEHPRDGLRVRLGSAAVASTTGRLKYPSWSQSAESPPAHHYNCLSARIASHAPAQIDNSEIILRPGMNSS